MGDGGQTDRNSDTHINTMTRPDLGAGPSEKNLRQESAYILSKLL